MGYGIGIKCNHCAYNKEFFLGVGMLYSDLKNILDSCVRSKRERNIIKNILDKEKINYINYEHSLYKCQKCNELYERLYIKIIYEGDIYEIKYKCSKCKKDLILIGNDVKVENINCPKCGKKSLYKNEIIMWD